MHTPTVRVVLSFLISSIMHCFAQYSSPAPRHDIPTISDDRSSRRGRRGGCRTSQTRAQAPQRCRRLRHAGSGGLFRRQRPSSATCGMRVLWSELRVKAAHQDIRHISVGYSPPAPRHLNINRAKDLRVSLGAPCGQAPDRPWSPNADIPRLRPGPCQNGRLRSVTRQTNHSRPLLARAARRCLAHRRLCQAKSRWTTAGLRQSPPASTASLCLDGRA